MEFGLPLPEIQEIIRCLLEGLLNEELFCQSCDILADIVSHQESMKLVRRDLSCILRM